MRKVLFLGIFILLMGMPFISAFDANITVKTDYPFRSLVVRVLGPNGNLIESIYPGKTDIRGNKELDYSTTKSEIGFLVFIVEEGKKLQESEFEAHSVNKPFVLDMRENPSEDVSITEENNSNKDYVKDGSSKNETITENVDGNTTSNESVAKSPTAAGNIISENNNFGLSSKFYYSFGLIVLLAFVIFVGGMVVHSRKREKLGLSKSKFVPKFKKDDSYGDRELAYAESKIREAQKEIDKIKNRNRIAEAEEKIKKDKEDLERLKKGE